jgi:hypothetical protein
MRFVGTTRKGIFFRKTSSLNTHSVDAEVVVIGIAMAPCECIDPSRRFIGQRKQGKAPEENPSLASPP